MLSPGDETVPARSTQRPPTLKWPMFIGKRRLGAWPHEIHHFDFETDQIALQLHSTR